MAADRRPVRRALLSVSDKTGLVELARGLHALGVDLLSTGGTARSLREAGLPVRDVSEVTGFPEIMDGRVKTLHPKIHGGLLGREGTDDAVMAEHGIAPIDLLVVNLYPFVQTVSKPGCSYDDAIEDRKSTRLNSSHVKISYAVLCLKKKRAPKQARKKRPP